MWSVMIILRRAIVFSPSRTAIPVPVCLMGSRTARTRQRAQTCFVLPLAHVVTTATSPPPELHTRVQGKDADIEELALFACRPTKPGVSCCSLPRAFLL